ncbi:MAG: hypothetical protein AAF242_06225, partial [Bacteroidota bacterium]
ILDIKVHDRISNQEKELLLICKAYGAIILGKKARIGKLINEMPELAKDKSAMNVNILALKVMRLLARKEYSKIIDLEDSLRVYRGKYLRKDSQYRSKVFITFLIRLTQSHMRKGILLMKAKKEMDDLTNHPLSTSRTLLLQEPVPYRFLIDWVLKELK